MQTGNIVRYKGLEYSTTNFVRLIRRELETRDIYATFDNGQRFRVYLVQFIGGQVTLDLCHSKVALDKVIRLDTGTYDVAF